MGRLRKVTAEGPVLSPVGKTGSRAALQSISLSQWLHHPKKCRSALDFAELRRTSPPAQAALPSVLITMG